MPEKPGEPQKETIASVKRHLSLPGLPLNPKALEKEDEEMEWRRLEMKTCPLLLNTLTQSQVCSGGWEMIAKLGFKINT
jgi:hypothetical protein